MIFLLIFSKMNILKFAHSCTTMLSRVQTSITPSSAISVKLVSFKRWYSNISYVRNLIYICLAGIFWLDESIAVDSEDGFGYTILLRLNFTEFYSHISKTIYSSTEQFLLRVMKSENLSQLSFNISYIITRNESVKEILFADLLKNRSYNFEVFTQYAINILAWRWLKF